MTRAATVPVLAATLLERGHAPDAARALARIDDAQARLALVHAARSGARDGSAHAAVVAIRHLGQELAPYAGELLGSRFARVRAAASSLAELGELARALREDESYVVRTRALELLAARGAWERTGPATHDPVWRVRAAFAELARRHDGAAAAFAGVPENPRTEGLRLLLDLPTGEAIRSGAVSPSVPSARLSDPDPGVLRRVLRDEGVDDLDEALWLLAFPDPVLRRRGRDALHRLADSATLARAYRLDPRLPGVQREWRWLATRLDEDRRDALRDTLEEGVARRTLEPEVSLAPLPPLHEVLGVDALPSPPPSRRVEAPAIASPTPSAPRVPLGRTGLEVSRLGLSGHYGLSVDGFREGLDAGINLFFWEPNYDSHTRFFRRLTPTLRDELVVVAGTFEGHAADVARDVDRALRLTQLGRIDLFLVFWVRSAARIDGGVRATLDARVEKGDLGAWGMSTHQRSLGRAYLEEGMDPMMVRLSAAHRGIEDEVLPTAREAGAGVLAFSNLTYGRMLQPAPGEPEGPLPEAWECYRYALEQPGVTATFTAPANAEQLAHNLRALRDPLTPERREILLRHGRAVRAEGTRFRSLLRER